MGEDRWQGGEKRNEGTRKGGACEEDGAQEAWTSQVDKNCRTQESKLRVRDIE